MSSRHALWQVFVDKYAQWLLLSSYPHNSVAIFVGLKFHDDGLRLTRLVVAAHSVRALDPDVVRVPFGQLEWSREGLSHGRLGVGPRLSWALNDAVDAQVVAARLVLDAVFDLSLGCCIDTTNVGSYLNFSDCDRTACFMSSVSRRTVC